MTRRVFIVIVSSAACSPLRPDSADSIVSAQTGSRLFLPTGQYIRSGKTTQDGTLLQTVAQQRPDVSPSQFVKGFDGIPFNNLVFFRNDQPFDDAGVANKSVVAGNSWGCMEYSQLLRK